MAVIGTGLRLAMILGLVIATGWVLGSRTTDRRELRVCASRQAGRGLRSAYARAVLTAIGWPHLVDVLLRTRKAAVGITPSDVIWTWGTASLRRYRSTTRPRGAPVLVVHSVITEPWILDLAEGHSLIGHLVAEGRDVYLLDWGAPERNEAGHGLAHRIELLRQAEQVVLDRSARRRLHLVGYCLGATICLVRVAMDRAPHVRSIVALAPPVDLSTGGKLARYLRHPLLRPAHLLDADSCVPAAVIRETFHALRPRALGSVRLGWRLRHDEASMAYYGAMARWAWEQRRLSGAMFLDLVDLFRSNGLLDGRLELNGTRVELSRVTCPVLVVVAERDHIVPLASSLALETGGPREVCVVPSGHVSMIAGTAARDGSWPALVRWLEAVPRRSPAR